MGKTNSEPGSTFEVASDLLFIDGAVLRRGDVIRVEELDERLVKMLMLGMIITKIARRRAA